MGQVRKKLSVQNAYIFNRTLNNMEYLAWLLNHDCIMMPRARELWIPGRQIFYNYAGKMRGKKTIRADYPELTKLTGEASPLAD